MTDTNKSVYDAITARISAVLKQNDKAGMQNILRRLNDTQLPESMKYDLRTHVYRLLAAMTFGFTAK